MSKPNHRTLVKKLVQHYSQDLDTATAHALLKQFKHAYDTENVAPMADWQWFLGSATTDNNVQLHLERTLNQYFSLRHYDWLLAQYKHVKQQSKTVA
jgi:hypothetical protein